jgi:hypothetical protein
MRRNFARPIRATWDFSHATDRAQILRILDELCRKPVRCCLVQVQSSWFPLYDRNPQTYVPNIFCAHAGDSVKATQRVYRSASAPSAVWLPAVP